MPFLDEQDETRSDKFAGRLSVAAAKFTQINSKCAPCLTSCSDCVRGWCAWCFPGTAHGVGVGATGGTSGGGTGAGLKPPEKHDGMRRHETGSSAGSDLNILDSVDLSLDDARAGLGGIPNGISELPFTSLPLSRHRRQTSQEISLGSGGFLTPNSSMVNLAAFAEAAEKHGSIVENINDLGAIQENDSSDTATSVGPSAASASLAGAPVRHLSGAPALLPSQSTKNALGEVGGAPADLGLAVSIAVRRDFDELVRVWSRDVRGRFLAHTKVLYWESLEEGRATKEVVETLVVRVARFPNPPPCLPIQGVNHFLFYFPQECADIALDTLDEPLCDWEALKHRVLGKAQKGSSLWKRLYRSLPGPLRETVKWTRQWVLHSGAVGAGGSRRRALVAAALFHDARREANHAIFGHLDENETHCEEKFGGKEIAREIKEIKQKKAADKVDINDVSLLYDSDDEKEGKVILFSQIRGTHCFTSNAPVTVVHTSRWDTTLTTFLFYKNSRRATRPRAGRGATRTPGSGAVCGRGEELLKGGADERAGVGGGGEKRRNRAKVARHRGAKRAGLCSEWVVNRSGSR